MRWPRSGLSGLPEALALAVGGSRSAAGSSQSEPPELPALRLSAEPAAEPGPAPGRPLSPVNQLGSLMRGLVPSNIPVQITRVNRLGAK